MALSLVNSDQDMAASLVNSDQDMAPSLVNSDQDMALVLLTVARSIRCTLYVGWPHSATD